MSELSSNMQRQLGATFADGPDRAPAGLLETSLARTAKTAQRSAVVAIALGAPVASGQAQRRVDVRWAWLLIALALVATTAAVALIGPPRPSLVVAPTRIPAPDVTAPPPIATPAPTVRPTAVVPASPRFSIDPGPPETRRLADLELTIPSGWNFSWASNAESLAVLDGAHLFARSMAVTALAPGAVIKVPRPEPSGQEFDVTAGFEISGATFAELVASIDAGAPDASRSNISVDGRAGYLWTVPQTSIVMPLVAVAALRWKGTFYVFYEQLALDGAPGRTFQVLLNGVHLV